MSFFKQGNSKALRFLARQLKMKPKSMMNKAHSITRGQKTGGSLTGRMKKLDVKRQSNRMSNDPDVSWEQYVDDFYSGE